MTVLYRHPRIWTGDPTSPWATALLTDRERLVAVGDAAVSRAQTAHARVVDLPGVLVIPGLHDAHIHTANLARDLVSVDLRPARSMDQALAMVHEHAAAAPVGIWLFGGRWDANKWSGRTIPDRHVLDRVSHDHPVALPSIDGHTMWANTIALKLAGITSSTPDPVGGRIERDETGEPTGILREQASEPLRDIQAGDASGALEPLLLHCQEELLSVGLTSVTDIDGEDARTAYLAMRESGRLRLRVTKAIPLVALDRAIAEGRRTGQGDDWMRVGPVKLFSDGALGSHTSYMSHEFPGDAGNHGMARMSVDEVAELTRKAVAAGIGVATHAIGDQANATVLDGYERVLRETGTDLRLRIEHTQHLKPADVGRIARLGVIASMQPTHCNSDIDLADELLAGQDLVSYGWKSLLDAGAVLALGSDSPVEEPNPFHGLYAAITRQRADGTPVGGWQPHERLSMTQALHAHTVGSAYAAGDEGRKGVLQPGMLADFVAVDTDILDEQVLAHEPVRVHDAQALATVVGGEIRWQATS
ncbi:amidohydrolase [Leekyejoonella antrihumi]|uniref:Amidohydrolase n=1 Tax=Leekyejoonella antrihumi TaxID=1660198 RepID=A0A563E7U1_9MICO|nr:amidohydrolase [Leekyejoonella antrihumi]TWP37894.1 amidohydrolase [Leekyejoonella antrihumi]